MLVLEAPRNLLEMHILRPPSDLLNQHPGEHSVVLTSPPGESDAHPIARTVALGWWWFSLAVPFSNGSSCTRVGTTATASHSLPLPHNPDSPSGPDLSEGPHSCPGGGSHRLREQSCSGKRVSAVPPAHCLQGAPPAPGRVAEE